MYYEFKKSDKGLHQLGGLPPEEFEIPANRFKVDFQYLGFINNQDKLMNWLPFRLHLICPIFVDFEKIYLDYVDELEPQIILPQNTRQYSTAFDELDRESIIQFRPIRFELNESKEIDEMDCLGIGNHPIHVQYYIGGKPLENDYHIPSCPITDQKMKFVCQLMTFGEVPVSHKNFESDSDYLNFMNFWCDGSLYVYCNPESRIVCYFIQNT